MELKKKPTIKLNKKLFKRLAVGAELQKWADSLS